MISKNFKSLLSGQRLISLAYYLVFSIVLFCIIYFKYSPELLNFKLQPFFSFDSSFADYYSNQNIGMLKVLSQFVLQFLAYPVIGSIIIVTLLIGLAFLINRLLNLKKYYFLKGIEFIPSFLIISTLKDYNLGLEILIMFTVVFLVLIIVRLIPQKLFLFRLLYYLVSITTIFFVFDVITVFVLTLLAILYELTVSKSIWKYSMPIISSALLFILVRYYLGFIMLSPILRELNSSNKWAIMPDLSLIIILTACLFLIIYLASWFSNIFKLLNRFPKELISIIPVILMLTIGTLFSKSLFTNSKKYCTQIEYDANTQQWAEVLGLKKQVCTDDRIALFELNRALYHNGQLASRLFSIPQNWGIHTLFLTVEFNRECTINSSDLFFDMGFIKGAKYWALEAQTHQPYSPRILKRLALCSVLLDETAIAEKYLNILSKSGVHKNWVSEIRKEINLSADPLKERLFGEQNLNFDIIYINNKKPHYNLLQMLSTDPDNRMAFEYLMACYLLDNEIGNFQYFLSKYGKYDDNKIPGSYQEALLLYIMTKQISEKELGNNIDKNVKARFLAFNKILMEYKLNEKKAKRDLNKLFGNTYWYYMKYLSPKITGNTLKRKNI